MVSCGTPKDIAYFQDRQPGTSAPAIIRNSTPFKVRPGDRVSIYVKSRNEKLSQQFNMYSGNNMSGMGLSSGQSGYLVDENGEIDFPVLGKLKLAGLDRKEITDETLPVIRQRAEQELQQLQERFQHQVFRIVIIPEIPSAERVHPCGISSIQLIYRQSVSL